MTILRQPLPPILSASWITVSFFWISSVSYLSFSFVPLLFLKSVILGCLSMFTNKGLGAGYRQQSSSLSSSKHLPVLTFSLLGRLAVPETEPTVCPRVGFSLGRIKVEAAGHVKVPTRGACGGVPSLLADYLLVWESRCLTSDQGTILSYPLRLRKAQGRPAFCRLASDSPFLHF